VGIEEKAVIVLGYNAESQVVGENLIAQG